jgi:hypothetical protein
VPFCEGGSRSKYQTSRETEVPADFLQGVYSPSLSAALS